MYFEFQQIDDISYIIGYIVWTVNEGRKTETDKLNLFSVICPSIKPWYLGYNCINQGPNATRSKHPALQVLFILLQWSSASAERQKNTLTRHIHLTDHKYTNGTLFLHSHVLEEKHSPWFNISASSDNSRNTLGH